MSQDEAQHKESMIGSMIRTRRRHLDMTQADLAAKMGVTRGLVAQWETNRSRVMADDMSRLADALQANISYLMGENYTVEADGKGPRPILNPAETVKDTLVSMIDQLDFTERTKLLAVAYDMFFDPGK